MSWTDHIVECKNRTTDEKRKFVLGIHAPAVSDSHVWSNSLIPYYNKKIDGYYDGVESIIWSEDVPNKWYFSSIENTQRLWDLEPLFEKEEKMGLETTFLQNKLIDHCSAKSSRALYLKELVELGALDPSKTYDEVAKIIKDYLNGKSDFTICIEGKQRALKALNLETNKTGITRYVIDVEYELYDPYKIYGKDNGETDCGTVVSGGDVMIGAILDKISVNDNKAVKAELVAYRTDVQPVEAFKQSLLA